LREQGEVLSSGLIVVERREFVRGCLTCWLAKYRGEIEAAVSVADVETGVAPDVLTHTAAAIIGMEPSGRLDWVHRQVAWLRAKMPGVPVILIAGTEQTKAARDLAIELDLQGYIPVYSSLELAAAAVQLVAAGGSYFPRPQDAEPRPKDLPPGQEYPLDELARLSELTSRERVVLNLLSSGMPNKVIAHRLGMSLSTVKAHVHHIIRKLKVANRTEVALLTQHTHAGTTDPASADVQPVVRESHSGPTIHVATGEASVSDYGCGGEVVKH
jgi:DNA-binding NarL/FixJ family response regulator